MAIQKKIIAKNGVPLEYHRISFVQKITNKCNLIQVASYTAEDMRSAESDAVENGTESELNIYVERELLRTEYDENMTIHDAYEILKQTEPFVGAVDC